MCDKPRDYKVNVRNSSCFTEILILNQNLKLIYLRLAYVKNYSFYSINNYASKCIVSASLTPNFFYFIMM